MPYIFSGLVIINILALGYFTLFYQPSPTASLQQAQASLSQPITFKNSAADIPPMIGSKN